MARTKDDYILMMNIVKILGALLLLYIIIQAVVSMGWL